MTKRKRLLWAFGGIACLALLGTLLQYDRVIQLYLRYKLERQPEELLRAYALSNDENKREAIRMFASTQEGGKRTASVLIQTLCDGVVEHASLPAMCSRGSRAGTVCDMEFYLGAFTNDIVMICSEEFLWDFSSDERGTSLKQDVVQYAGVLLSALSGRTVQIESIGDSSALILEVEELAAGVKTELFTPVFPYRARLRADDREKLKRFGKVLMEKGFLTRTRRMRAAEALGKLSTPEAISVLQDALALDLDRHLRAAVEKALDEALARGASENRG